MVQEGTSLASSSVFRHPMRFIIAALLLIEATVALLVPVSPVPVLQQQISARAAVAAPVTSGVFPTSTLIADDEVLSPAKAKARAAAEAAEAKRAARGISAPEAKSTGFNINFEFAKDDDPYAEADELRGKIRELQAQGGSLSKSKSAKLAQLKIMEKKARGKASAEVNRVAERASAREAEKNAPASFNKISPIKLPFLD